jgi:hypothetical protein
MSSLIEPDHSLVPSETVTSSADHSKRTSPIWKYSRCALPDENKALLYCLTEVPYQNTPRTKTRVKHAHHQDKMCDKFVKLRRINDAIAAIRRGEFTDYANAAREYKCDRGALSRRICGLTKSKKDANSFWH